MPRSRQTLGRSSFLMPTRSMRCPPVSLTSGTSYFRRRRRCGAARAGVQMPPGISGMTEKVPSFWMLAWTRSLMKRASRSSSYSPFQTVLSSDASAGLLAGSSLPPASASNTADTDFRPCSRIAFDELGLAQRNAGHVVVDRGILLDLAAAEPLDQLADQALAGAAAHAGAGRVHHRLGAALAGRDAGADRRLGDAVAVADLRVGRHLVERDLLRRRAESNSSDSRSSGSGVFAVEGLHQVGGLADVAHAGCRRPAGRRGRSASCRCPSSARRTGRPRRASSAGSVMPIEASSTPMTLSLVASFEP